MTPQEFADWSRRAIESSSWSELVLFAETITEAYKRTAAHGYAGWRSYRCADAVNQMLLAKERLLLKLALAVDDFIEAIAHEPRIPSAVLFDDDSRFSKAEAKIDALLKEVRAT